MSIIMLKSISSEHILKVVWSNLIFFVRISGLFSIAVQENIMRFHHLMHLYYNRSLIQQEERDFCLQTLCFN